MSAPLSVSQLFISFDVETSDRGNGYTAALEPATGFVSRGLCPQINYSAMPNENFALRYRTRDELADLSITDASELLRHGRISPVQLTRSCLDRTRQLNNTLNAFITVTAESAMAQAEAAEVEISAGNWRGPLHGIPIALKDLIDVAGVRTTAGSALLQDNVAEQDAEVVTRLRQAGAVLIGKTNLHEFAYGGSSVISHFGPVRNAWDPEHIAGGSSGGSATAVAAGMCLAAIGTDTAGSIRLPASFCGVVGLKPTYGLVSGRGVIPLAWSYDHVGPITRTVTDAAILLQAIAGFDPDDIFSGKVPTYDYRSVVGESLETVRIGIPGEPFMDDLHPDVASALERALALFALRAIVTRDVAIPQEVDRTAANGESYVYHAQHIAEHPELYQPSTLDRLHAGRQVTAGDYIKARHRLEKLRRQAHALFNNIDVLVAPTVAIPPPTISELMADPATLRKKEILMLRNTRPFNVLATPAMSIPCGVTSNGLPVGLQIAAAPGREDVLLSIAHTFERAIAYIPDR